MNLRCIALLIVAIVGVRFDADGQAATRIDFGGEHLGDPLPRAEPNCSKLDSLRVCFKTAQVAGVSSSAEFTYYHDRLAWVTVSLSSAEYRALVSGLTTTYGRPIPRRAQAGSASGRVADSTSLRWVIGPETVTVRRGVRDDLQGSLVASAPSLRSLWSKSPVNLESSAQRLRDGRSFEDAGAQYRQAAAERLQAGDTLGGVGTLIEAGSAELLGSAFDRGASDFARARGLDSIRYRDSSDSYLLVMQGMALRLAGHSDAALAVYSRARLELKRQGSTRFLDDPVADQRLHRDSARYLDLAISLQHKHGPMCPPPPSAPGTTTFGMWCGADSLLAREADSLRSLIARAESSTVVPRGLHYEAASLLWLTLSESAAILEERGNHADAEHLFVGGLRAYSSTQNKPRAEVIGSWAPTAHIHLEFACRRTNRPACAFGGNPADLRARAESEHLLGDVEGESLTLRRLLDDYTAVSDTRGIEWATQRSRWVQHILSLAAGNVTAATADSVPNGTLHATPVVAATPATPLVPAVAPDARAGDGLDSLRERSRREASAGHPDSAIATLEGARTMFRDASVDEKRVTSTVRAARELSALYRRRGRPLDALRTLFRANVLLSQYATNGDFAMRLEHLYVLADIGTTYHRALTHADIFRATLYYDSASTAALNVLRLALPDEYRTALTERMAEMHGEWALAWLANGGDDALQTNEHMALAAMEFGRGRALQLLRGSFTGSEIGVDSQFTIQGAHLAVMNGQSWSGTTVDYALAGDTLMTFVLDGLNNGFQVLRTRIDTAQLNADITKVRAAAMRPDTQARIASRRPNAADRSRGVDDDDEASRRGADTSLFRLDCLLFPDTVLKRLGEGTELAIIVDGALAELPFAVLRRDSSVRPLGLEHALRFAPSMALLDVTGYRPGLPADTVVCDEQTGPMLCVAHFSGPPSDPVTAKRYFAAVSAARRKWLKGSLVVGDPKMPTLRRADTGASLTFPALPEARKEARDVATLMGVSPLIDTAATETAVRARMAEARVIHFATHGLAYGAPAFARRSFIALAAGAGNDGALEMGEILGDSSLSLRAELVVLSACETARGARTSSEGTIGIQRAFLARGAKSLIVSQWKVSDESTRLLMTEFYRGWLDPLLGLDKAQALQRAQEIVRKQYPSPYYWGAFQLVGGK